jgi:hypothetical protein
VKNIENATECYVCPKSQVSVFHNYTGYNAHIRDCNGKSDEKKYVVNDDDKVSNLNFTNNQVVRYLTIKNQMEKYRETKYYISFDIEIMEELVSPNLNGKNNKKIKIKENNFSDGT